MPPKYPTRERAWGTRYDTLDSSPPPSPPAKHIPSPITIPHTPPTSVVLSSDLRDPTGEDPAIVSPGDAAKSDKMPHDASIFVGSLPSNVDHAELTRLLFDHLSEHTEVKNVKVVRDSKGGVCAFVQCEDSNAATRLIQALRSLPPRPFLGRILRYEPARAFRTLLISYRYAIKHSPAIGIDDSQDGDKLQPEPVYALRIYRPRNARYLGILYNGEALNFSTPVETPPFDDPARTDGFSGNGLLLASFEYDVETLRTLAQSFGVIEQFDPYAPDPDNTSANKPLPHPHDCLRSANMDPNVWEVKWNHRDDCVSALMTLRRIPFVNVSWAHHAGPTPGPMPETQKLSPSTSFGSRFCPSSMRMRTLPHYRQDTTNEFQRLRVSGGHASPKYESTVAPHRMPSFSPQVSLSPASDRWTFAHSTPFLGAPSSPLVPGNSELSGLRPTGGQERSPNWSETDFPPLADMERSEPCRRDVRRWGDSDPHEAGIDEFEEAPATSESSSSSLSVNASTPLAESESQSPRVEERSLVLSQGSTIDGRLDVNSVPPTPDFCVSPITPRTSHNFPRTPISAVGMESMGDFHHHGEGTFDTAQRGFNTPKTGRNKSRDREESWLRDADREVDPTTIFVGGLEMYGENTWDAAKLQSLFGRFGHIEDIQFVRPLNKRSAFAFIKFDNTQSPARAVLEEHNRIHNGRQIRVQLRDTAPSQRSPWRFNRGRGRFPHAGHPRVNDGERSVDLNVGSGDRSTTAPLETALTPGQNKSFSGNPFAVANSTSPIHTRPFSVARNDTQKWPTGTGVHGQLGNADALSAGITSDASSTIKVSSSRSDMPGDMRPDTLHSLATPSSASAGTPMDAAQAQMQHFPMASMGYFPHPPWFPAYPSHYPYPVPFVHGYPGYHVPPAQGLPTFPGSDVANAPAAPTGAQNMWANMYRPVVPYASYPPVTPSSDSNQGPPFNTQPPLRPTGFIEGEHGTLIPVYQPEALNQYMSSAQHTQSTHNQSPPPQMSIQPPPPPAWPHYPQVPMYPYAAPAQSIAPSASQQAQVAQQRGWVPSPAPFTFPPLPHQLQAPGVSPPYALPPGSSSSLSSSSSFRGSYTGATHSVYQYAHRNTPPPKRFNRREQNNGFNNHGPRSSPHRFAKLNAPGAYGFTEQTT